MIPSGTVTDMWGVFCLIPSLPLAGSWTVIPVEERDAYMAALERAGVDNDIRDFAKFLGRLTKSELK